MSAVIPMGPPDVDIEQRTRERAASVIERFTRRLDELKRDDPDADAYPLPLPWYAHENSRELELIVEHFRTCWKSFYVRRGAGCLELLFLK